MYILILISFFIHALCAAWEIYNTNWQTVTILCRSDINHIMKYTTKNKHIFYNNLNVSLYDLDELHNHSIKRLNNRHHLLNCAEVETIYYDRLGIFYPFYDSNFKVRGFLSWNKKPIIENNKENILVYPIIKLMSKYSTIEYLNNIYNSNRFNKKNHLFYMNDFIESDGDILHHDCVIRNFNSKMIESSASKILINYVIKKFSKHKMFDNDVPSCAILLVGPSGCGKSMIISYLVHLLKMYIFVVDKLVENIFNYSENTIMVMDNIERVDVHTIKRLKFTLKVNEYADKAIFICTSNNITDIDKELLSMFTLVVNMDYMNWEEFDEMCKLYFGKNGNILCSNYKKINNCLLVQKAIFFLSAYSVDIAFEKYMEFVKLEIGA
jgi:hypothetical protein